MAGAELKQGILGDAALMGIRATIGVIFIVHGLSKFGNEGFLGWMSSLGISPEFAMLIALAEVIPGILLLAGVLGRISASILSMIMVGAIFYIKNAEAFTGEGSYEFDLMILASCLFIIVAGPGRISISHAIQKIPRWLH